MKKKDNLILTLLFVFSIILIIFITIPKTIQNDLFFDIRSGRDLLKYGLDFKDHFSFIPNLKYLYHHYLYNIIILFIFNNFSYHGIFVFFTFIACLIGITILHVNNKNLKNPFIAFIITIITILLCSYSFVDRVQTITYLLFYIEIYLLEKLYDSGEKKYCVFLILISLLIANLHMPIWIFTIILTLPFLVEIFFYVFQKKYQIIKKLELKSNFPANFKSFIITIIMMILMGFMTPFKLHTFTFMTKVLNTNSYGFISEMQPTILISDIKLLVLFFISIITLIFFKKNIKVRDLLLIGGLLMFSLIVKRNIIYSLLILPTYLAKIIFKNVNIKLKMNLVKKINWNVIYLMMCVFVIFLFAYAVQSINFKTFDYRINEHYPVKIVDYIKEEYDYENLKVYTDFNYGSYVAFNNIPIFVDSRAEVYIAEFNGGQNIIKDYINSKKYKTFNDIFEKYDFDIAIVYKEINLYNYLLNSTNYKLVKEADAFALFERVSE